MVRSPRAEQQPEHRHLAEAQVVVGVPLAGEAPAQAHHADAELGGEPGVGAGNGCVVGMSLA